MPFRKYNYAIPQVMPHAIPQTHSAFYPHRFRIELRVHGHHFGNICHVLPEHKDRINKKTTFPT